MNSSECEKREEGEGGSILFLELSDGNGFIGEFGNRTLSLFTNLPNKKKKKKKKKKLVLG